MTPREPRNHDTIQAHKPAGSRNVPVQSSAETVGIQAEKPLPPWEQPDCFRLDCEPHRGTLLYWMAVISVACSTVGMGLLILPVTLTAWYVARQDLALMKRGRVDPAGERQTKNARDACIVALVITPLAMLYMLALIFDR